MPITTRENKTPKTTGSNLAIVINEQRQVIVSYVHRKWPFIFLENESI